MKQKKQLVHHPPDKLRCRRTDGKGWRCSKLIASNSEAFCQEHYNYHNNNKPTLKSKRKSNTNKGEQVPSDETRMQRRRSLEQCEDGGLEEESEESLAARILNCSGGGNLREESESLEARVSPPSDCNDDDDGGDGGNSSKKKTTKFTQEQEDKMLEFGQRLGWRILKKDEAAVEQFCDEICVKPQLLKSWLHRKKQILARVLNPSSCGGGGGLGKKCPRTIFTREQNDKMLEFGTRIGWKIRKKDEDAAEQLCEETGVEDRILRIWLRNKKHRLGFKSQEGRVESQSKIKGVETRKQCLKVETKSCSEESKFRETMKCHEGSVEFENKIMEFIAIEEKYRDGLKEWISCLEEQKTISEREKKAQERITNLRITCLEEEKEVICEREKKAQERITYLEAELRNMGRDDIEKYVLLSTDNRIRECVKRRAEDEVEVCEKRFCDLETRVLRMEEESSTLGYMESHLCGKIELEPCGLQNEVSDHNDGKFDKKDINKMSKLQAKTNGGTNSSHVVHSQTKEKVLNSNKQIHASAFQGYGSRGGQTNSEIERRNFETRKQCLEVGTKRYSEKSKLGDPGDTFEIESEKNLEVYKKKCHELSVELERKKMECIAIQDKYGDGLKVWTSCLEDKKAIGERGKRAQERITNLRIICQEEDKKVMCEREKRAQERIAYLEEVLRKTERNQIEKYAQLSTENRYLEFAKRRAEDELEIWKRKFCELETRVLRMEEEFEDNSTLRCMETRACGNIELEPGHLQNEVSSQ